MELEVAQEALSSFPGTPCARAHDAERFLLVHKHGRALCGHKYLENPEDSARSKPTLVPNHFPGGFSLLCWLLGPFVKPNS